MLKLNNLLYVPNIKINLIFVSKFFKDHNVYFEFHSNKRYVKKQASSLVLLKGFLDDRGLYFFISNNSQNVCYFLNNTNVILRSDNAILFPNCVSIWNSSLGHANPRGIHIIHDLCNIHLSNKNYVEYYNSCCLGKSHRLHAPLSQTKYTCSFDLIHTYL